MCKRKVKSRTIKVRLWNKEKTGIRAKKGENT